MRVSYACMQTHSFQSEATAHPWEFSFGKSHGSKQTVHYVFENTTLADSLHTDSLTNLTLTYLDEPTPHSHFPWTNPRTPHTFTSLDEPPRPLTNLTALTPLTNTPHSNSLNERPHTLTTSRTYNTFHLHHFSPSPTLHLHQHCTPLPQTLPTPTPTPKLYKDHLTRPFSRCNSLQVNRVQVRIE